MYGGSVDERAKLTSVDERSWLEKKKKKKKTMQQQQ